jgi:transposase
MDECTFASLFKLLFAPAADLRLDALALDVDHRQITLTVASTQATATCPLCHQPTTRIHSRYGRSLADLPWADVAVRLALRVRRFFCLTPACPRTIFTERLPTLVAPWARRTQRLTTHHQVVGLALGGAAGARVATAVDQPASRNTLLRGVRRIPEPEVTTPKHLGVDDFARRKGQTYGTILVDLDQHCPIELLPDRTAETLEQWLATHPGVELISRDRAGAYAEGASQGAPEAVQVADRWHLLSNVADALKRIFAAYPQALRPPSAPAEREGQPGTTAPPGQSDVAGVLVHAEAMPALARPVALTHAEQRQHQCQQRRQARYDHVQTLAAQGVSLRTIATQLHLSRGTVRKYARASAAPVPQPRANRVSVLDPYKAYLVERWNAGCHVGAELLREIEAQGYRGGRSIVMDFVAAIRKQQGVAPLKRTGLAKQAARDPSPHAPTPRELSWLVLKQPDARDAEEQATLLQVQQAEPRLEVAVTLMEEFARMVRERQHERLDAWLERAEASGLSGVNSLASGIRRDYAAVKAALSSPYSNGVVEGNVNRLKYLKRQMYGRANFDLLRKRVVYAT